jgi:hypothetical protein
VPEAPVPGVTWPLGTAAVLGIFAASVAGRRAVAIVRLNGLPDPAAAGGSPDPEGGQRDHDEGSDQEADGEEATGDGRHDQEGVHDNWSQIRVPRLP